MSNRLYRIEYKYTNILFWRNCSSKHVASQEEFESQICLTGLHVYRLLWGNSRLTSMTCSNPLIAFFPTEKHAKKNMQCLSMHWISETASWHSHRQFFYVWGAVAGAWCFKLNFVWLQSNLKPVFFFRFVPVGQLWATSIFDLHRLTRRWSEMTILRLTQFILQLSPAFSLSPSKMDAGHQCGCSMALKPVALIQLNHIETCWTIKGVICQPIAAASMSWYPEVVGWSG